MTDTIVKQLLEKEAKADPIDLFREWYELAWANIHQANAMTVATMTPDGKPDARMVLLKEYNERGFVFFTNYNSKKSFQLEENPNATLLFWWDPFERQIRIEGSVEKTSDEESDTYFASRPRGSQIGAWASPQSEVLLSRDILEDRFKQVEEYYKDKDVARPPHWGGWRVVPERIEFWQGRPDRLHDRLVYTKQDREWKIQRLAP